MHEVVKMHKVMAQLSRAASSTAGTGNPVIKPRTSSSQFSLSNAIADSAQHLSKAHFYIFIIVRDGRNKTPCHCLSVNAAASGLIESPPTQRCNRLVLPKRIFSVYLT
eukprot:482065_1